MQSDPIISPANSAQSSTASRKELAPSEGSVVHVEVGNPKRGIAGVIGIIALSLMLLAVPLGVYLVSQQRTQISSKAAVFEPVPEAGAGIFLESKLSQESQAGVIPVDVFVKSSFDEINLVDAKIKFDKSLVSIDKIATASALVGGKTVFNHWLESSFDNNKGAISIIAGLPTPGVKTGIDDKVYLATVFLKSLRPGSAVLQIDQGSKILRNADSIDIFKTGNDLVLNLTAPIKEASASATPTPSLGVKSKDVAEVPVIVVTSPMTAANYSYFNSMSILWSSFNTEIISAINLYVNGELLGPIAENIKADSGKFDWNVQEGLALLYVQPANTFEIEVVGVSKDDKIARAKSGPFGILGSEEVKGSPPNPEVFIQNQLTIGDASRLMSGFLAEPVTQQSLDFNKDGILNDLDFFLLRQNLAGRGVVK